MNIWKCQACGGRQREGDNLLIRCLTCGSPYLELEGSRVTRPERIYRDYDYGSATSAFSITGSSLGGYFLDYDEFGRVLLVKP